jgi:medium-chain acyl-[acyl-carrier-protein] hydrolase
MPSSSTIDVWLPFRRPNPAARVRLLCLPFAGGGASAFRPWADGLPLTVEVGAVQPPGRETRFRDPPFIRLSQYVTALANDLTPLLDLPVAVCGHSMGALAAFELAREWRRRGQPGPERLILTGRAAPHLPPRRKPIHTLPDREFRSELKALGGTPAAVIDNDELMAALLPTLRADFTVLETYEYTEEAPLDCPILAMTGAEDTVAPPADVEQWRSHTRSRFDIRVLPGDHFFIQTQRTLLLQALTRVLCSPA